MTLSSCSLSTILSSQPSARFIAFSKSFSIMFIFLATSSYFLSASTARYLASLCLFSSCSIWSSLAMVSLSRSFLTRSALSATMLTPDMSVVLFPSPARFGSEIFGFTGFRHARFLLTLKNFFGNQLVCLRSGIKANSSVRKFPERYQEIFGFQVLLRWSRVSMEAGCMLMLGGGVFGRGPLGQGATSACRGWWCCLRKAEWVQNRPKGRFFWTLGQGPRRRLSDPERVPWSARTGEEGQSRS